ncbi:MAG: hypothetical protein JXR41_08495 [Bacteroidales bacterium]|nr:hypothetical protein [Bacteroidales bacterium]
MIRYLPHNEIDRLKWDECIAGSSISLPYAFSWYLDIVSPGWDGLVSDDYQAVMPIPFKRKWSVNYIYKPYFAQQLGIFSAEAPTEKLCKDFILQIPSKFRYAQTNLNESNPAVSDYTRTLNTNHVIRVDRDYSDIHNGYSRNCRRNIRKAFDGGLRPVSDLDIHTFVRFIFNNLEHKVSKLDKAQSIMLEKIIAASQEKAGGELTGIYTPQHELCAAGFFMQTKDRQIFSVCASSEKGKHYDAMYMLVDEHIRKAAGIKKRFDFSGSNIKGIAYFNKSFGAEAVTYPTLHLNRLPFPLCLLKR